MYLKTGSTGRLVTFPPESKENLLHARKVRAARDGGANSFRFCSSVFASRKRGGSDDIVSLSAPDME